MDPPSPSPLRPQTTRQRRLLDLRPETTCHRRRLDLRLPVNGDRGRLDFEPTSARAVYIYFFKVRNQSHTQPLVTVLIRLGHDLM